MEANNAKLRAAVEEIITGYEKSDFCDLNYGEWCHASANGCANVSLCKAIHKARAALAAPARICDKMNRHKAIWDCRNWLKMHGYRLTSKQDDIMCETIWWLYDETKEAEVKYERK